MVYPIFHAVARIWPGGNLASIPGCTEDGPGIDCLRMRYLLLRNWVIWITSHMLSKTMTSQRTEVD